MLVNQWQRQKKEQQKETQVIWIQSIGYRNPDRNQIGIAASNWNLHSDKTPLTVALRQ